MTLKGFARGFGDVTNVFGDNDPDSSKQGGAMGYVERGWQLAGDHLNAAAKEASAGEEEPTGKEQGS